MQPTKSLFRKVLVFALISAPLSAGAEGAADAMKAFGLGGSWSSNCAASTGRFRVSVNVLGRPPTVTVDLRIQSVTEIAESEIIEATRINDDQMRLKLRLVKFTGAGNRPDKYEQTWGKVNSKFRINKDFLLEKCPN